MRRSAAGVEKPSRRPCGIHMKELKQLLLEIPELAERSFRNIKNAQEDKSAKKREIGIRIGCALEFRQIKPILQTMQKYCRAVQRLGHFSERMHSRNQSTGSGSPVARSTLARCVGQEQ